MSSGRYYIYSFVDENDVVLYVGKTKNLKTRIQSHIREKSWMDEGYKVYIAETISQTDMDIYELYYINKLNPIHNVANAYNENFSTDIKALKFQLYKTIEADDLPLLIEKEPETKDGSTHDNNYYEEPPFDHRVGMVLSKHIYKKFNDHLSGLDFVSGYEFTYSDCGHESLRFRFLLSNSIEILIVINGCCGDLMLLRDGFYHTNLKDVLTEIYKGEYCTQLGAVVCQVNIRSNGYHTGISIYNGGDDY